MITRHGTTTLFAALNVLGGTVIGECKARHRHQEFLQFLRRLDREFPLPLDLHLIVDNYGTHKHSKVKNWQARHRRFHLHFIPTSSSWLNLVERWFGKLTQQRIRRGSFFSVKELVHAITEYLENNNRQPKPFIWTASVEKILEKVNRCKAILETVHYFRMRKTSRRSMLCHASSVHLWSTTTSNSSLSGRFLKTDGRVVDQWSCPETNAEHKSKRDIEKCHATA